MPNRSAKLRKQQKAKLNKKWALEGRTAGQHKQWLAKQKNNPIIKFGRQ
tara:strand:- start:546 stop:692 length:147 start_codon:yes stop_codon:yes gene_type:complete